LPDAAQIWSGGETALHQLAAAEKDARGGEKKLSLTAIILTCNEEIHIERCLIGLRDIAARIIVVDSFSSDGTIEIARALGAEVFTRRWKNYADQFQWALDNVAITTDWIVRLDADEYFEPALKRELAERLPSLGASVVGVQLRRKVIFRGRWIRHGGYYPTLLLRIWRNGSGRIEQRWMDEHIVLPGGQCVAFASDFVDHNLNDITHWTDKHNRYATRQMVDFINLEFGLFPVDRALEAGAGSQARLKRFLRNGVFGRAPLYWRGLAYFFLRYVLRLGFLDGRAGFVFHFLQGLWNWILVDAKIEEARAFIASHGVEAFRERLKSHYGVDLSVARPDEPADAA
jgi:glycosyltransferase involved in cell wall biosynthesis